MLRKAFQTLKYTNKRAFSSITIPLVIFLIIQGKFDVHRLEADAFPKEIETNTEELMNFFELMTKMRRLEITIDQAYKNQEIRGFCHLYDGQVRDILKKGSCFSRN